MLLLWNVQISCIWIAIFDVQSRLGRRPQPYRRALAQTDTASSFRQADSRNAFRSISFCIFAYVCHEIHPALQPNRRFQGFPWVQALGWRGTRSGCHQLQWRRWGRWRPGHRSWQWKPCISGYKQRFPVENLPEINPLVEASHWHMWQ